MPSRKAPVNPPPNDKDDKQQTVVYRLSDEETIRWCVERLGLAEVLAILSKIARETESPHLSGK